VPKKPTNPYGHIAFGKDGSFEGKMRKLSSDKATQEEDVVNNFARAFARHDPRGTMRLLEPLPEADHDYLVEVDGQKVELQVTELICSDFGSPLSGDVSGARSLGGGPFRIDDAKRDAALAKKIEKKVLKCYAPSQGRKTWLLVFSTTAAYLTEHFEAGVLKTSPGLYNARTYCAGVANLVFHEIWFTNLQTRPIRVWPVRV